MEQAPKSSASTSFATPACAGPGLFGDAENCKAGTGGEQRGNAGTALPTKAPTVRSPHVLRLGWSKEVEADFCSRVSAGDPEECWPWLGSKTTGRLRYGTFWDAKAGRSIRAHRLAYELSNGAIQDGLLVRHKCDNPICVNPWHLELGTHADNIRDRDGRGRHRGSSWPHAPIPAKPSCAPQGVSTERSRVVPTAGAVR